MKRLAGKADIILLLVIGALVLFGMMMIASAGVAHSRIRFGDEYYLFRHQLFLGLLPGVVLFYICQKINYRFWKKLSMPFFAAAVALLALIFIGDKGFGFQGAQRWLTFGEFSFQPSEVAKLALIIYLAAWLERRADRIRSFSEVLVPLVMIVGLVGFLIVLQPDIGTLGIIVAVAAAIYYAAGASLRHFAMLVASGAAVFLVLVRTQAYRVNRLLAFFNPEFDPQGIGYQIRQALVAIGSGGIFGVGLGHSRQKFNYLPEPVGDSIFAIIGEELGLLGTLGVVLLFVVFAMRGLKIAKNAPDIFGRLAAVGITSWLVFQAFLNMAGITGLVPLTGIPLPFISYGGTSLMFSLAAAGILLNISKHAKT